MMKLVIVNCFDTYEDRVDLVHETFREQGYDVTVIQSDFRHFKKIHRKDIKDDFIFVKSNSYYKNLSVSRLFSHYIFARDSFKIVEKIKPDLLFTFVPPNSLAKFAAMYKKKHKEVRLIFDLIDLWPETLPIRSVKKWMPFSFWGSMRDKSLKYADLVFTECDLFQSVLGHAIKNVKTETLYLANREIDVFSNLQLTDKQINLAYLGSINNIIDIPMIKDIIETITRFKHVTLHIIGDGEKKQELIDTAELSGATVEYHGKIYVPQEKQDIFDKCHFGLNIMKSSVCVGLTMKSIDYFQHGLPIINNIPADTSRIIEKYGVGINISNTFNLINDIRKFNKNFNYNKKRESVFKIFNIFFSEFAFKNRLTRILLENGYILHDS